MTPNSENCFGACWAWQAQRKIVPEPEPVAPVNSLGYGMNAGCPKIIHSYFKQRMLHRVNKPLNWMLRPKDGELRKDKLTLRGQASRCIREGVSIPGASFFQPSSESAASVHQYLGFNVHGCCLLQPDVELPSNLKLVPDIRLVLPLYSPEELIDCGQHWSLYAEEDMLISDFETAYNQLLAAHSLPCTMRAEAEPLDIDDERTPGDKLTQVCVAAMDDLGVVAQDPNNKLFSQLFALHLRAQDMAFSEILQLPPIAHMAAVALEGWKVHDPLMHAYALQAQNMLAEMLGYVPTRPKYKPYWVSPTC
jgi:hypothetical protein